MAFPAENSTEDTVCKFLFEEGAATASAIEAATGVKKAAIAHIFNSGYLARCFNWKTGYTYALSLDMLRFYAGGAKRPTVMQIVQPRTFEFKPWSGKHNLPTGRIDTSRTFITLSSAVPATSIPWRQ